MRYALLAIVLAGCSHDSWHEVDSKTGHYHVDFPGDAVERVEKQMSLPAVTEVHHALVDRGSRGSFQITYYELAAPLSAETSLSAAKLDCLSPFVDGEFTIGEQKAQPLGTAPGYIVIATASKSSAHPDGAFETLWCVVNGTRMFHVLAVGKETPEQHADTTRFIASFRLL